MPRSVLADLLQSHRFWLMDVVPSGTIPFLVLGSPFLGFSSITAPEYTFEVEEVKQMNSMFKKKIYSGGDVGPITMTRGVRGYDDTMWQWVKRAITGADVIPRNLLLIQYTNINLFNAAGLDLPSAPDIPVAAWEAAQFLPGKAWLLWGSIPTRYKAASDFDATSGAVSIGEIEVQAEGLVEMTLMSPL